MLYLLLTISIAEFQDGSQLAHHTVPGNEIKDLSVIDLPKDKKKKVKNTKEKAMKQNNGYGSSHSTPVQAALQDDAILFYRSSTPSRENESRGGNNNNNNNGGSQKKKLLKRKEHNHYSNNDHDITWGDDIAQIKGSNDFDFESSTAGFDKHAALEEFVNSDKIDPSQRLAAHNKLKSPVKTKYDNDENVIGTKIDKWEQSGSEHSIVNERTRVSERTTKNLNSIIRDTSRPRYSTRSPSLEFRGSQFICSNSKDVLPLASPIQLLEIERLSNETFKISPQLIAENASRSLGSIVIKILGGSSRISNKNHNLPPLVLILVGNNRSGSSALATGRQLTNHGVRVIAFTLTDFNSVDEFDDNVGQQLELFQLAGGKCTSSLSGLNKIISDIDSPIELVIDALQGYDTNLSDLWGSELDLAAQLINWVTEQEISTLSIDIPSGIDAGSGLIGDLGCINAKWVASLGLPVNGLLHAYANGAVDRGEWTHYLVDVGLPSNLFKKGSLRKFDRNWFSGDWTANFEIADR